jgi:hypothetical protein
MFAYSQAALALALEHAFWLFFFIVGSLTLASLPKRAPAQRDPAAALAELVTATATGMAVTALYGFVAGIFGVFYTWALPLLVVLLAVLAYARGVRVTGGAFWRNRFEVVRGSLTLPSVAIYVLGLAIALPAILPDVTTDPNMLHLPYALDWARAHRLTVDPALRFPYYVMNWQLLYSWLFLFGLGNWTALLSTLCGILTALGIQAALLPRLRSGDREASPRWFAPAVAIAAPLMLLLSPTFLRWDVSSMIDIPIALFFLVVALLASNGLEGETERTSLVRLILCGGFLVGLKPTFFLFIPMIAVLIVLVARRAPLPKYGAAIAILLFLITASPWYVKSFVEDGDPVAPYLNLAVAGRDAQFSRTDWQNIGLDLVGVRDLGTLVKLPYRVVFHTNTVKFREYGVTLGLLGMYLPFVFLWWVLVSQSQVWLRDRRLLVFASCTGFGAIYWMASSYLARYSLLFTPTLCVCLGLWLIYLARRGTAAALAAIVLAALCAVPSPSAYEWLGHTILAYYRYLPDVYKSRNDYLVNNLDGYREEQYVASIERRPGHTKRVLALCCQDLAYQFKLHGVTLVGDYVGPARYLDITIAIHQNRVADYVERFGVDAILIKRNFFFSPLEDAELTEQAEALGFVVAPALDRQHILLVKDLAPRS